MYFSKLVQSSTSDVPHLVKASGYLYKCDDRCPMFKGFSLCSHVAAAAQTNGELRAFINTFSDSFTPNLAAISERDIPSRSGRKGGIAKRKRKKNPTPETTSVRQSLTSPMTITSLRTPCNATSGSEGLPSVVSPNSATFGNPSSVCNSSLAVPTSTPTQFPMNATYSTSSSNMFLSPNPLVPTAAFPFTAQSQASALCTGTPNSCALVPTCIPISYPPPASVNVCTANSCAVIGSGVVFSSNYGNAPFTSTISDRNVMSLVSPVHRNINNFVLKLKTSRIKVCQSCRKNYDGDNDTMGLIALRAECRVVTNITTGVQFLSKESNSHYHVHMNCLRQAMPQFTASNITIPQGTALRSSKNLSSNMHSGTNASPYFQLSSFKH